MWSIIDLLEKLVNGFSLFGGSTFEQVEDEAQLAPGCMVCAQQGCKVLCSCLLRYVLPELACPRDQAVWPLGSLPLPLKGGGDPGPASGTLVALQ